MSEMLLFPRYSNVRLFNPTTGEMSEMEFLESHNDVRLFNLATGEMSEMEFLESHNDVSLVNSAKGERSDTELLLRERPSAPTYSVPRSSRVRLVAASSPVKSLILAFGALSTVNVAISGAVMGSADALPSWIAIAARRLGSGISTICAIAVNGIERQIKKNKAR